LTDSPKVDASAPAIPRRLTIVEGPGAGTVFPLILKETLIGRIDSAHLVLDHLSVSRLHARIVLKDEHAYIQDLHSREGTWVNGVAVGVPRKLENGDVLCFGDVVANYAG
jgi:pSer/pThr/pTyr-binding forkhead associated (FHA) protein